MFSRSKPEAPPAPPPQAGKRLNRSSAPSIISADLVVKGTLVSTGDIQIDGRVEGDIRTSALVIGDKASIQGDVYADDAIIRGHVQGSIRARKVQLCTSCRVEGDILHEALAVETGAFFEGNCRHSDNPLAEPASGDMRRPGHEAFERKGVAIASPLKAAAGHDAAPARAGASFMPLKG